MSEFCSLLHSSQCFLCAVCMHRWIRIPTSILTCRIKKWLNPMKGARVNNTSWVLFLQPHFIVIPKENKYLITESQTTYINCKSFHSKLSFPFRKSMTSIKIHNWAVFHWHALDNRKCNINKTEYQWFLQFNCIASAWYFSNSASRSSADTFSSRPLPRPLPLRLPPRPLGAPRGLPSGPFLPCPLFKSQRHDTDNQLKYRILACLKFEIANSKWFP